MLWDTIGTLALGLLLRFSTLCESDVLLNMTEHQLLGINYKIAILTFKALNNMAPSYLVELVNRYQPSRPLGSANHNLLQTSQIRLARYGARSFSHLAPDLWNSHAFRKYTVL